MPQPFLLTDLFTDKTSVEVCRSGSNCFGSADRPGPVDRSGLLAWWCFLLLIVLATQQFESASAGDWPMWRFDANRSAAAPDALPDKLRLAWMRKGTPREQAWDDPLNLDLMSYDRLFEPVVLDGRMFVGHSDTDKLAAIDVKSGEELWSFYTEAPIRLAPVAWQGAVYVTSDDGRLYCLQAETGELRWQFQAAPGPRKVIGNQRLISAWPVRGGTVIRDGKLYFASSIWPFMGVFIYALDAETGEVAWVNDSTGSSYIKQPHSAPSFAGVGPQGAFVATDKELIVPGGRSVPAVFDRQTGELKYFELNAGGKGTGGSVVMATEKQFFVHTRLKGVREFNLADGKKTAFTPNEPVLHGELVYSAEESKDKPLVRAYDSKREKLWEIAADGRGDLILAGDVLYAAGPEGLSAIQLPKPGQPKGGEPQVLWSTKVEGTVERLLAAADRLFAVTLEGDILCFARSSVPRPKVHHLSARQLELDTAATEQRERLLAVSPADGYALWYGAAEAALVDAFAAGHPFVQLAVVDEDAARVDELRRRWDAAGLYGKITAHVATPQGFDASPYMAQHVFVGRELSNRLAADPAALAKVYDSVRPYGGVLQLLAGENHQELAAQVQRVPLEQAEIELTPDAVVVRRVGALPGSADWTHLHGDIGNTRKSNDTRVKLPLGILWFGGSSHMDVLPRHGHGPPQQVVDGRLFIQGINILSARDVYTGQVLWKREFEDLGTFDVYYDDTYQETPLDPSYNQVHIPGANARGTNYVVTSDRIYVVEGAACLVLDPATGETLQKIELPQDDPQNPREWSYIGIYDDLLIGGVGFANYRDRLDLSFAEEDEKLSKSKAGFGSKSLDRAGSLALVAFDRRTGETLWKVDAKHSFWNNAIVAGGGKIYCLDRNPKPVEDKLKRRGVPNPVTYRILALDARTGETAWEASEGIFGTWLGYSAKHDMLLQAGAAASDRLSVEVDRGMTVYRGTDGSIVWSKPDLRYSGPCIIHNDLIITNTNSYKESSGAFYLENGEQYVITNPVTGQQEPWIITRAYGCNTILASENLLTFRSGAAGFYDLTNHSGTGNFGGFKSGCTGNLIVANGVLNAPDYTRTCSCSYQNQTSLALVHMPEIETWTLSNLVKRDDTPRPLESLGVNLAAPGHQRDAQGVIWIEAPAATAEDPPVAVHVKHDPKFFRRHSSALSGTDLPWIFASGIQGDAELEIGLLIGNPEKQKEEMPPTAYRLRAYVGNPTGGSETISRFDLFVNDQLVLSDLSVTGAEFAVHDVAPQLLSETVRIRFVAREGAPVLSGIELQRVTGD